jgi:hypothetical protein
MSTLLWLLLAVLYIKLSVTLAMTTFRKGHHLLFSVGVLLPMLWLIGAASAPTAYAEARHAAA